MSGGHFKNFNSLGYQVGIVPKLRRGLNGPLINVLENKKPLENTSSSTNPLLIPKIISGEENISQRTRIAVLQTGGSEKSLPEKATEERIDKSDSTDSDSESEELQKKINEAFSRPVKVKSLHLLGKRSKEDKSEVEVPPIKKKKTDQTSPTNQSHKKLKTFKFKVI